ncbi:MAG TPA: hypothetical protein VKX25_01150 [Bryobacteraceae bacterium]|jgi:hypothetical protein|nr:hypothetical protein [Bryobacteraceae bacterium]
MPVVSANLTPAVFTELMNLVDQGRYATPEQFVKVAVFNQLTVERAAVETAEGPLSGGVAAAIQKRKPKAGPAAVLPSQWKDSVFDDLDIKATLDRLALPPNGDCREFPHVPEGIGMQPIWGQVNRMFPLKLACRWILLRSCEGPAWPKLNLALDQIPREAGVVGRFLESLDVAAGRTREEALSAGLPKAGKLSSSDRFAGQYLARVSRADRIHPGVVFQLGLACLAGDEVQLTCRGKELAMLENPVLDQEFTSAKQTLSVEERSFLVAHIIDSVPAERNDQLCVLRAIRDGHLTPAGLLSYIRASFPREWSDLEFRTHVYGILARLTELGQIRRARAGRNVHYRLTDRALEMVERLGKEKIA